MLFTTLLQADLAAVEAVAQQELNFSLIDMAFKGGWLMLPLLLLSIITIYLFSMKLMEIRRAGKISPEFMREIEEYILAGKRGTAKQICQEANTPISRMIEKGIDRMGRPLQDIQTAVENVANVEVAKLEKGLPMIATIAGGAPMIGFLGTVIGMVQAFFNMAQAGNNVDITLLSGGIYTAMVTTVAGLTVGILAYFGYNYLSSQVSNVVFKMENTTVEFMDLLQD